MKAEDIKLGRCYAAAKPAPVGAEGLLNDRQIKWINDTRTRVQYDGPAVRHGSRYPVLALEKFAEWAAADITDTLPPGEWRSK